MKTLARTFACALFLVSAPAFASDPSPLEHVLDDAANVVRGNALESYVKNHFTYTRVAVSEVFKGNVPIGNALVRQPGAGEEGTSLWQAGEDAIVLLEARDESDDSYPIADFPAGRYRIVTKDDGEDRVLVSAMGVDAIYLSPKDKRPRAASEEMPLAAFAALARGTHGDAGNPPPMRSAASVVVDAAVVIDVVPSPTASPTNIAAASAARPRVRPYWIVLAIVLAALVALRIVLRRRA